MFEKTQCIVLAGFGGIFKDPPLEKMSEWAQSLLGFMKSTYFLFRLVIQNESLKIRLCCLELAHSPNMIIDFRSLWRINPTLFEKQPKAYLWTQKMQQSKYYMQYSKLSVVCMYCFLMKF